MVGADNELKRMIKGWDENELKEFCASHGMKWQFIMPLAPYQNGCSEGMVKSVKIALKKAIGEAMLTPFELYTCLLEVAKPVCVLSKDRRSFLEKMVQGCPTPLNSAEKMECAKTKHND